MAFCQQVEEELCWHASTLLADLFRILLVTHIGDGYAHHDLLTVQGTIERHRECALHKGHGFLVYPTRSGTLDHFGIHQLSCTGNDCFDQDFEPA